MKVVSFIAALLAAAAIATPPPHLGARDVEVMKTHSLEHRSGRANCICVGTRCLKYTCPYLVPQLPNSKMRLR